MQVPNHKGILFTAGNANHLQLLWRWKERKHEGQTLDENLAGHVLLTVNGSPIYEGLISARVFAEDVFHLLENVLKEEFSKTFNLRHNTSFAVALKMRMDGTVIFSFPDQPDRDSVYAPLSKVRAVFTSFLSDLGYRQLNPELDSVNLTERISKLVPPKEKAKSKRKA